MVEGGDFYKIRRQQFETQRNIAKKRNETFLKVGNKYSSNKLIFEIYVEVYTGSQNKFFFIENIKIFLMSYISKIIFMNF